MVFRKASREDNEFSSWSVVWFCRIIEIKSWCKTNTLERAEQF